MYSRIGCVCKITSIFAFFTFWINPHYVEGNFAACGVSKISSGLIVRANGSFLRGEFPWIVALIQTKFKPVSFFCGGTLISSTFVITAAHCILDKHAHEPLLREEIFALFGAHNLKDPYETEKISLSPKNIIIHHDWNPFLPDFDADIALLEFQKVFTVDSLYIQPICLWNSEMEPLPSGQGMVTGWGKSEDPSQIHSNEAKLLKVLIQSNEECVYGERELFDLSSLRTFCAGLKNGSGVCSGDSGGGLFVKISGAYYLKGIVSSSLLKDESCDVSKNAVYTNVIKFKSWIDEKTRATGLRPSRPNNYHTIHSRPARPVTRPTWPTAIPTRITNVASVQNSQHVFCKLQFLRSRFLKKDAYTCAIEQDITNEEYFIEGSQVDQTVESFLIQNTSVASIPREIGATFPNLYELQVYRSRITKVRRFFFENMENLLYMSLSSFQDATIDADAFKDLVSLKQLFLDCGIETLDRNIFSTTVKLEEIYLNNNKIKTLDPRTFKIPGGRLRVVNLQANKCIGKFYWSNDFPRLEADIAAMCRR